MLNLRVFVTALCFILGGFLNVATAQTGSQDANDWIALQSGPNIFALREALENDLQASDGVRALAVAYIGAFSRDFDIANQRLDYARRYARARNDVVFALSSAHESSWCQQQYHQHHQTSCSFLQCGLYRQPIQPGREPYICGGRSCIPQKPS